MPWNFLTDDERARLESLDDFVSSSNEGADEATRAPETMFERLDRIIPDSPDAEAFDREEADRITTWLDLDNLTAPEKADFSGPAIDTVPNDQEEKTHSNLTDDQLVRLLNFDFPPSDPDNEIDQKIVDDLISSPRAKKEAKKRVHLKLLTNSRINSWNDCHRKHYFYYTLRRRAKKTSEALYFGTVMHLCLEQYWLSRQRNENEEQRLVAAVSVLYDHAAYPAYEKMDPFVRAKLSVMLAGYTAFWDRINVKVLAVEIEFQLPLINPETGGTSRSWKIGGKLDAILEWHDIVVFPHRVGQMCILEHKSSGEDISLGSTYRRKLAMDGQVSHYFEACTEIGKQFGHDKADFLIYDVLAKPKLQPYQATPMEEREYKKERSKQCKECKKKKAEPGPHRYVEYENTDESDIGGTTAEPKIILDTLCRDGRIVTEPGGQLYANQRERDETPEEYEDRCLSAITESVDKYFAQIEVVRLDRETNEHRFDIWSIGNDIRDSERTGFASRNTRSCFAHHGECDYWSVCALGSSIEDDGLYRLAEDEHEELSTGAKPL